MANHPTKRYGDKLYRSIVTLLSSRQFFVFILVLLALQAIWYAFSLQPTINDEPKHLGGIHFYAQSILPFVDHQAKYWDVFGSLTRSGSYMYYYLMSWPFRLVSWLTDSTMAQVIFLRLINTIFVITAVVYFRKSLKIVGGLPEVAMNMLLLFFVLTPAVALLAGTVNYDNLTLLIFAYLLFVSLRIIKSRVINVTDLVLFFALGLIMVIVKWTSICLFAPMTLFVVFSLYATHGSDIFGRMAEDIRRLSKPRLAILLCLLIVSIGLFLERPVTNYFHYGKIEPSCNKVLNNQRCLNYPDYAIYQKVLINKPADFQPADPVHYVVDVWAPKMVTSATNLLETPSTQIPAAILLYSMVMISGSILFLLAARDILRQDSKLRIYLLIILIVYIAFLMFSEYSTYRQYGIPAAIRTRYLIPVLPIAGYFIALSVVSLFGKYRKSLTIAALLILILMIQGGGITTYVITTPEGLYWPNTTERRLNHEFRDMLQPVIKE